jgi:plastocyanin
MRRADAAGRRRGGAGVALPAAAGGRRGRAGAFLPAAAVLALVVGGCGSGSDLGATAGARTHGSASSSGGTVHVVMQSLDFSPIVIHASVGQTVVWTNEDDAPHNVTYVSGPRFTSSRPQLERGAKFSLRLTEPGTIHYYCTIHPWMKASIVVSS